MSIIDDFLSHYVREIEFYKRLANAGAERCQKILDERNIQAIVTSRAKRPDRLREKLEKRDAKRSYSSLDDIYTDIPDLAGVRIALYFPKERATVDRLLRDSFDVSQVKIFPEDSDNSSVSSSRSSAALYPTRLAADSTGRYIIHDESAAGYALREHGGCHSGQNGENDRGLGDVHEIRAGFHRRTDRPDANRRKRQRLADCDERRDRYRKHGATRDQAEKLIRESTHERPGNEPDAERADAENEIERYIREHQHER
jgi:hypothetical protein